MSDRRDEKPAGASRAAEPPVTVDAAEAQQIMRLVNTAEKFIRRCEEMASGLEDPLYSNDPQARLVFMTGAVGSALEFLQTAVPGSNAYVPLIELVTELQSIGEGRGSRILAVPKTMKGPAPSEALLNLQVYAVASIDALRTGDTRMKLPDAARLVAKYIDRAGVRLPSKTGKNRQTHQQLLQWRTQIFSRSAKSTPERVLCREITKGLLERQAEADGGLEAGIVRALEYHLATVFSAAHTGRPK